MVNDPRNPIPRSANPHEPRDPLDLLHELARDRVSGAPPSQPAPSHGEPGDAKLESLRALTESLNRQLRAPPAAAPEPAYDPAAFSSSDPAADPASYPPQDFPAQGYPAQGYPAQGYPPQDHPPHDAMPPARSGPGSWRRAAQFEWAAFADGLPPARALVPRLGVPEIVFVAIAAVVLVAVAVGGYVHHRRVLAAHEAVVPPVVPSETQAPGASPAADEPPEPTIADIKKAMSDCDAGAAQDPDQLNFLVLPLLRTNPADTSWNPVPLQTVGSGYALLGANDALAGLQNGKLKVRPGRYTFSVLDTLSGTTYSWTSATRMSRLARKDPTGMKTLKLGFDFSANQVGPQWSAEFKRDRGTCYWVSVLVR